MKILRSRKEVIAKIDTLYNSSIGLVPTMGAIHKGHLSLISRSIKENDCTVCSVFVNKTQFDSDEDFKNYPRTPQEDIEKIAAIGCNFAFLPSEEEMFSSKHYEHFKWNLEHLDTIMEGKFRKNHFQGVANIVYNLFKIFNPTRAYFGEKDFQQLCVIKKVASIKALDVTIIPCSTQRSAQGLAISSRNQRVSKQGKKIAANLYAALHFAKELILQKKELQAIKRAVHKKFFSSQDHHTPKLEYFEFATEDSLIPVDVMPENKIVRAFVAAYVEGVRLIDNLRMN